MKDSIVNQLKSILGFTNIELLEDLQELWSGYGQIKRYELSGCAVPSLIIKHIRLLKQENHPRGWNTEISYQRKLRSYYNEMRWYKEWNTRTNDSFRSPDLYYAEQSDESIFLALEDLDAAGYPKRKSIVSLDDIKLCLSYLANWHAEFMLEEPVGLWNEGSYWHLETRTEEWEALEAGKLKILSKEIAASLSKAKYQTIIHGDAKLANFCFSKDSARIAALDFQYSGGGCGMKDVAYLLSSCENSILWQAREEELLDYYFKELEKGIIRSKKSIDWKELEQEWRDLYVFAWADFIRFLKGWMPGHWKIDDHALQKLEQAFHKLKVKF